MSTSRLCSITGKLHSHIPLHRLNTGFSFLILELFTFELFIEEGIFLLLTFCTFLPGGLSIHSTVYTLSHILEEGKVRGIANYGARRVRSGRCTERSERMEARSLSIRDLPADSVLSEFFLMFVIESIKPFGVGL